MPYTPPPLKIAQTIVDWSVSQELLIKLMEEDRIFRFSSMDMPARLLFARYISFCHDKIKRPEIFCWPGVWFAGVRCSEESEAIFNRNCALFVDKEEDDGIFPVALSGRDSSIVHQTFNQFYNWIVIYDFISQWIIEKGPFKYEYEWLSNNHNLSEVKSWVAGGFECSFGIHPDSFEIL